MESEIIVVTKTWHNLIRSSVIIGIGLPLIYILSRSAGAYIKKRTSEHLGLMVRKTIFLIGFAKMTICVLYEIGFKLNAL